MAISMARQRVAMVMAFGACAYLAFPVSPAAQQSTPVASPVAASQQPAKGSAEASAAIRMNPKWKAPRTPWGHPDLQGIWTSDDMHGVAMYTVGSAFRSRQRAILI